MSDDDLLGDEHVRAYIDSVIAASRSGDSRHPGWCLNLSDVIPERR